VIRPARPDDAPAIAEIWNRSSATPVITFTTAEKDADALAAAIAEGMPYHVAEDAGASWASSPPSSSAAARATPIRSSIPSTWPAGGAGPWAWAAR
jgi:L-amino acid N-acyltransferase YncA